MAVRRIDIKVERSTGNPSKPFHTLYSRIVEVDSSISVPFNSLMDMLQFLYGADVVVTFSLLTYSKRNEG